MNNNASVRPWLISSDADIFAFEAIKLLKTMIRKSFSRVHRALPFSMLTQFLGLVDRRPGRLWSFICHKPKGA
jgi:hypothetical protein